MSKNGPGSGGISRGRGDAPLAYSNETLGSTESFEAQKLPPNAALSNEWSLVGISKAKPVENAVEAGASGAAGAEGVGDATWRRRIAPRHREAVRRFFSQDSPPR